MTLWLEDLNESYNTLNSPGGSSVRCAFMIPNFCLVLSISEPTSSIKFLKLHDYHLSCKYIYVHVDDDLRHKCIFQKIHLAYSLEKTVL